MSVAPAKRAVLVRVKTIKWPRRGQDRQECLSYRPKLPCVPSPPLRLGGALLFLLAFALGAQARLNLPQPAMTILLGEPVREKLASELAGAPAGAAPSLSAAAQQLILASLPDEVRAGCADMVSSWGEFPQNQPRWTLRGLQLLRQGQRVVVFFAYRCSSTYADYAHYADDRLAVLVLEPGSARLRLMALGEDCENCSELYRLQFSQRLLVEGGELAELVVSSSTDNPCCGGPDRFEVESLLYVLLPEVEPGLTLERSKRHYSHDDVEGDEVESCAAALDYRKDPGGRLMEITAQTSCRSDGQTRSRESRRYAWNPAGRRFDQLRPTQP